MSGLVTIRSMSTPYEYSPLTTYTWTEDTDNNARQTVVSRQVADLHVLLVFCRKAVGIHQDSRARF